MLKIKLARFGKKGQPHYRIVVNEARTKRDGKYIALLGQYAPAQTPKILKINVEEYNNWLKKGAKPTDTVASLFKRFESGKPFPKKKAKLSKKAQAKLKAKQEEEAKPKTEEKNNTEVKKEEAKPVEESEEKKEA